MLVQVDGAERPSCVVLPTDGRDSPAWRVEFLDKMGYRGVESAAYEFDEFESADAEVLGGQRCLGSGAAQMLDALDVGRINVACRALGILDRVSGAAATQALDREIGDGVLADDELARLRRDAPQTQIGEGANDALLFALARDVLALWSPEQVPDAWRSPQGEATPL